MQINIFGIYMKKLNKLLTYKLDYTGSPFPIIICLRYLKRRKRHVNIYLYKEEIIVTNNPVLILFVLIMNPSMLIELYNKQKGQNNAVN